MIGALLAKRVMASTFDAANRHDLQKFMSTWHEDAVLIYPGDIPESGTFQGRGAIEGWFRRFFEQFPEIGFEIQDICVRNIFDLVGNNVIAVRWNLKLKNREGKVGKNSGVTVVTVRGGKAVAVQDYIFDLGDEFHRNWGAA